MFRRIADFLGHFTVRIFVTAILIVVVTYVVVIRNMYYHATATQRSSVGNSWLQRGFTVAIVWPPHTDLSLVEGVTLAREELDKSASPLAGKIHLKFFTETEREGGAELAREVVSQPDVLAVIGHELIGEAIPSSVVYEEHGVLFLSPKNTDIRLTRHGFNYVFRMTADDAAMTHAMAAFALEQGWKRVGVVYGRTDHGEAASGQFVARAKAANLQIAFFRSFLHESDWVNQDFRPLVGELRREDFDAVMLADQLPWAAKLLVDMARMGLNQPIIATDKLDSLQVWTIAQIAANNLYVASSVNPDSKEPAYLSFRERFRKRFGADPGYGASQGFEAMKLYIDAVTLSQSADPVVVATTLRSVTMAKPWQGLFGTFSFAANGDVQNRAISIKKMDKGRFTTVESMMLDDSEPDSNMEPFEPTPPAPVSPPAPVKEIK
jgi:branched-chain amino acid transport system substrate-binding protein